MKDGLLNCILEYGYRDKRCKTECSTYYKECGKIVKKICNKLKVEISVKKKGGSDNGQDTIR